MSLIRKTLPRWRTLRAALRTNSPGGHGAGLQPRACGVPLKHKGTMISEFVDQIMCLYKSALLS